MSGILKLLASDSFIVYNKHIAKVVGVDEAIVLGELLSQYTYNKEEQFCCTMKTIEQNTSLTDYRITKAIKKLKLLGIIDVVRRGVPAKNYYEFYEDVVLKILGNKNTQNLGTSSPKFKELDDPNLRNYYIYNKRNNKKNNNKKSKTTQKSILKFLESKSLEYDIDDEVYDGLVKFFTILEKNKKLITEEKIIATLTNLAKYEKDIQLKAIKLSVDKGYMNIDPEWLDEVKNKKPKGSYHNAHRTEVFKETSTAGQRF